MTLGGDVDVDVLEVDVVNVDVIDVDVLDADVLVVDDFVAPTTSASTTWPSCISSPKRAIMASPRSFTQGTMAGSRRPDARQSCREAINKSNAASA